MQRGYFKLSKTQCRDIRKIYESGKSSSEIAAKYSCSCLTVLKAVKLAGGKVRPPGIPRHDWQKRIPKAIDIDYRRNGLYVLISCPFGGPTCTARKPRWLQLARKVTHEHPFTGICMGCSLNKGGGINTNGYRVIQIKRKSVLEHRYVWEKHHGPIPPGATVHHKNGVRDDNRIENLELWLGSHGKGQRASDIEKDSIQHLIELGYLVIRKEDVNAAFIH